MTRAIAVTSWLPAPWIIANRQTRAACSKIHIGSFITWAWPGRSPITKTFFPIRSCQGFTAATASGAPAASSVRFPARALSGPPLTGESTQAMPWAARSAAMRSMDSWPIVDISA